MSATHIQISSPDSAAVTIHRDTIIEFAQAFDPQPYHLDEAAGDASIFGGLCASGWQVAAYSTRLLADTLLAQSIPFVEITSVAEMRWKRPTFVGEQLTLQVTPGDTTPQSVVPGCQSMQVTVDVMNQDANVVASMNAVVAVEEDR